MVFLSPLALIGLVAAAVPLLLHLFQRRAPVEVEFPAVRYLEESARQARRAIRLRHLLLMALRMLAVALVVLAAARPVVPGSLGGPHEPTALVLVLDNSLSSGAVTSGRRVLDDLAARVGETLREASDADAVWLLAADGIARRARASDLLETVGGLEPEPRRLDLGTAAREAMRLAARSGYARAEVHLLTDLQATALSDPESGRDPGSGSGDGPLPVLVYRPAGQPPANLGVAAARPVPALWLAGTAGGVVSAALAGTAAESAAAFPVSLVMDGRTSARALAGPGREVALAARRVEAGWRTGEVALEPDELRADDRRPFAVRVVRPAAVAPAGAAETGPFVLEALGALADAGQVSLDAAGEVSVGPSVRGCPPARSRLCASVVLPPPDPTRLGALNRALAALGVPWTFGARVLAEDTVSAPGIPELRGARVLERLELERGPGAAEGSVLARAGGAPWIVRHGTTVLIGSRLVPDETSLPLSGRFVSFVGALVNRVARGEVSVPEAGPGEPVMLPAGVTAIGLGDSVRPAEGSDVLTAPVRPGVWALLAGADTVGMLVVAADPRESDLRRADAARVAAAFPGAAVEVVDDPRAYAARRFRGSGRSELAGWLLVLALVVLVAESAVAAAGARRAA